eukprot:TRINITY_DN6104_c0_g1_i1.p1 TRINITY_DN6104_c0_g1~~TRINITY_DN6104_c0_g1_i1.p1  ORF type:complete len:569 (-),score=69.02 TRINITY_DN6104_c0_g1_i1:84-1721(-)
MKKGKDNKAVIASNIMYIVGQYPRFLHAHWKFLKTVVHKLFEFMHEMHPGVQDMACDTFLKICKQCRTKFVETQVSETHPFVEEILRELPRIVSDLEPQQIHTFYEAVGYMICSHPNPNVRKVLVMKFLELPIQTWANIMQEANRNITFLNDLQTIKTIVNILKTCTAATRSLGYNFIYQLGNIFLDILNVYKAYSQEISDTVARQGAVATKYSNIRTMRAVKKEVLELLQTFIAAAEDPQVVMTNFLPRLFQAILMDYQSNIPVARDPEVLSLLCVIINKFQAKMTESIPSILAAVFECTLQMITKNFADFPTCRVYFFDLLQAINKHCFRAFFALPPQKFKLVIDSIVWAFKHTMRNIAETGLTILLELWSNISTSPAEIAQGFYKTYFLSLMQDVFYVLCDAFHKSGFSMQAQILRSMFSMVETGKIAVPLWDTSKISGQMTNQQFLRQHVAQLLLGAFPHVGKPKLETFVQGMFQLSNDPDKFKQILRDFLVQLKEFSGDNSELFLEENEARARQQREAEVQRALSVPGMVGPYDKRRNQT